MAIRTGKVIMAKNIKLDKSYNNVLSYTEQQMVSLLTSNAVETFTDCSFLRQGENAIKLDMAYNNAIKCNYIGFQNPDYSNKWFFGFIDEVEYVSNGTVIVRYTIDEFSTWWDYWQPEECFVEREHAMDDTPGANLVPEQLELGEYVKNGPHEQVTFDDLQGGCIAVMSPYDPDGQTTWYSTVVNGIPISGCLTFYTDMPNFKEAMKSYAQHGQADTITAVYLVPGGLVDFANDCTVMHQGTVNEYYLYNGSNNPKQQDFHILPRPDSLGGSAIFQPVNGKMYTYPYVGVVLHNYAGSSNVLAYEYFEDPTDPVIRSKGSLNVGCSIISYPLNYKGWPSNYLEGISCGKFPTLSWSADLYTNWMTQNAVNNALGIGGGLFDIGLGVASAAAGGDSAGQAIGSGVKEIFNVLHEIYQHSLVPVASRGNVNQGDLFSGDKNNTIFAQSVSITAQFARRIDKYFTRFGYRTNETKIPNQMGRTYWNFVKIAPGEDIGHSTSSDYFSVPTKSMETINGIYQHGVTIWHNHTNIGDYSLSNTIVSS